MPRTSGRQRGPPVITLTTDFAPSHYVAQMKGVILGICPTARIVDISHAIPAQNVIDGAFVLSSAVGAFSKSRAIHVGVVDPGVGTDRSPIAIATKAGILIGPDNGLLVPAARRLGIVAVRQITNPRLLADEVSATFHGRDVFAPVAARLAAGLPVSNVGPVVEQYFDLPLERFEERADHVVGIVVHVDHFGNIVVNLPAAVVTKRWRFGDSIRITIMGRPVDVPLLRTYGDGVRDKLQAMISSAGYLELALPGGSAQSLLQVRHGDVVDVRSA